MPKIMEVACEVCGQRYTTIEGAAACEAQPPTEPTLAVGDVVLAGGARYGWFDGDDKWVATTVKERGKKLYEFYYIVTAIDKDQGSRGTIDSAAFTGVAEHRWRYHLVTKAMLNGYSEGHTFDVHHITPHKVKAPRYIIKTGADLLGRKTDRLL